MSETNDMSRGHDMRLAEAYIPIQMYGDIFDPRTALKYGTLFPELYRPFTVRPKA